MRKFVLCYFNAQPKSSEKYLQTQNAATRGVIYTFTYKYVVSEMQTHHARYMSIDKKGRQREVEKVGDICDMSALDVSNRIHSTEALDSSKSHNLRAETQNCGHTHAHTEGGGGASCNVPLSKSYRVQV